MMTQEDRDRLIRIDERTKKLVDGHADQERRIRNLERFRNWAAGAAATISALLGIKLNLH